MNNPSSNDLLTCIFVKMLNLLEIKSEREVINFVSEKEFMNYYPIVVPDIKIRDFVLLNNYEKNIWIEVVLTEKYLDLNNLRPIGSKLFLGKICNIIKNKPYNFGTHVYFTLAQVLEVKAYDELFKMYSK